jgi:hypothetical protein
MPDSDNEADAGLNEAIEKACKNRPKVTEKKGATSAGNLWHSELLTILVCIGIAIGIVLLTNVISDQHARTMQVIADLTERITLLEKLTNAPVV